MAYLSDVWYCVALTGGIGTTALRRAICEQPIVHGAPTKQDVFIINVHRVLTSLHHRAGHPLPPELQRMGNGATVALAGPN